MADDTPVTMQDVFAWYEMQRQQAALKVAEMELRKRIFAQYFPAPTEGTNSHPLSDGYVMKGKHNIDRKVEEAVLTTLKKEFKEAKINVDKLVKWQPELALKEYRLLEADKSEEGVKRLHLFDQALVIKPGAPALEIVLPKK